MPSVLYTGTIMKSIKKFSVFVFFTFSVFFLISEVGAAPDLDELTTSVVKIRYNGTQATGFLISEEGYILTCGHLFLNKYIAEKDDEIKPENISIQLFDPIEYADSVQLISFKKPHTKGTIRGHYNEYAILKINKKYLAKRKILEFVNAPAKLTGENLYHISVGATHTPRLGKTFVFSYDGAVILTGNPFHGGDSGSPLLDWQGKVVGMNLANQKVFINAALPEVEMGGSLSYPGLKSILDPAICNILDGPD